MAVLGKILLPTDGSPNAQAAAAWVGDLVRDAKDTTVTVLNVFPLYTNYDLNGASAFAIPSDAEIAEITQPILTDAVKALGEVAAHVETRSELGTPAERIVDIAAKGGYDLIVMGRRGHNPLVTLLIGSVSDRVVHLARCPVLVISQ
jgi:nucleotide-binding universal stress UspA family protein